MPLSPRAIIADILILLIISIVVIPNRISESTGLRAFIMSRSPASPSSAPTDAGQTLDDVTETGEVADIGEASDGIEAGETEAGEMPAVPVSPTRPGLFRNALQPEPPLPVPSRGQALQLLQAQTQPQPQQAQIQKAQTSAAVPPGATDSLSLKQLRRIVAEAHRPESVAYNFVYADIGSHADEIDEWFVYQLWQWVRLNAAQKVFDWHWTLEVGGNLAWEDSDHDTHARFVQTAIAGVQSNDVTLRSASIGKLVYLVLGRWADTAMAGVSGTSGSTASPSQLQAIKAGVECLASLEGLPVVWEALRACFEMHWSGDMQQQASRQESQDELINLMTIMYIAIQETLNDPVDMVSAYEKLLGLNPCLPDFMFTATSKLRWDEKNAMPHTQIFLLFWKSILLVFGGSKDLERVKQATGEMDATEWAEKPTVTASPLDYHAFRQEITSKYPAYVPPPPYFPLEAEHTSLLPLGPSQSHRNHAAGGIIPVPAHAAQGGGSSILHQPVHIATPAPSPPSSPGVGGKGGKKQNYQTNQNFPFMYPPLDATSNSAGGKGAASVHDAAVCRKWEGSDIPASILEAGKLFSSRVKMTRALRQLFDEREHFLKDDGGLHHDAGQGLDDVCQLSPDELTAEEMQVMKEVKALLKEEKASRPAEADVDFGPCPERLSERDKQRLVAIERFYKEALPHLQSLVIVLLRPILVNVTAIVAQQSAQIGHGMAGRSNNLGMGGAGPAMQRGPSDAAVLLTRREEPELSSEEVDATRSREITTKAMTAILLLLLKWLRVSHVLSFEYLTQLLLDSNYIPLVLKLFAHQDIQQVVDSKMDRVASSFFSFCNLRSRYKDKIESDFENEDGDEAKQSSDQRGGDEESDDSAAPPAIKRQRSSETGGPGPSEEEDEAEGGGDGQPPGRPEVDELGYPINPLSAEPITDFSRRNLFSLINYLRVMQKICKDKAHRNLLLVQYKSSTILRRSLRIPQEQLRLYMLKLIKSQVPYCGHKWRQSNMRVITAIYLHCRPQLRDAWLAGSDLDAEVDEALPLEQALRSLTHWRNVRRYPDKIAVDIRTAMCEEQDYFTRELEKLDFHLPEPALDDGDGSEFDLAEGWT